jgi:hypothetical protein
VPSLPHAGHAVLTAAGAARSKAAAFPRADYRRRPNRLRVEDGWFAGVRDVANYLLRIADTTTGARARRVQRRVGRPPPAARRRPRSGAGGG